MNSTKQENEINSKPSSPVQHQRNHILNKHRKMLRERTPKEWHSLIMNTSRDAHLRLHLHALVWWDYGSNLLKPKPGQPEAWRKFKTDQVDPYFLIGIEPFKDEARIIRALGRIEYDKPENRIYRHSYDKNYKAHKHGGPGGTYSEAEDDTTGQVEETTMRAEVQGVQGCDPGRVELEEGPGCSLPGSKESHSNFRPLNSEVIQQAQEETIARLRKALHEARSRQSDQGVH